jgi:hypothetical protein
VAEPNNEAATAPKLNVVTVNELLGGLLGGVVVGAIKLNCRDEMAIRRHHVGPILEHLHPRFSGHFRNFAFANQIVRTVVAIRVIDTALRRIMR